MKKISLFTVLGLREIHDGADLGHRLGQDSAAG